jgi:HlyD family secretion protein
MSILQKFADGPAPGQKRKEFEGVYLVKDGRAEFVPVKLGIAGEKHFEVLSGIKEGDVVITGPFASVRGLREGDQVTVTKAPAFGATKSGG